MSTTNTASGNWRYNLDNIMYIVNSFLSYSSIMLNIVAIHALRKTFSLPTTLKTLLLSLAVSDLGVGLLVQPWRIAGLAMGLLQDEGRRNITLYNAHTITMNLFYYASFLGVMVLAVERFLAIHLHLRYQRLVTHKRVVTIVISLWVISVFLSMFVFVIRKVRFVIYTTVEVFCLISTALLFFKIYLTVRRLSRQMQHMQPAGGQNSVARRKKSTVATFYVYLVFLACYLPQNCLQIASISHGSQDTLYDDFEIYTLTLVFLNSSLNPLIYCWKMKQIRKAILNVLRNMNPRHN